MIEISRELFHKSISRDLGYLNLDRRRQDVLHDKKWFVFLKRASLFRYIPFIEFVFGSGSMAIGNVSKHSDFDVLIGIKRGRIFTARFLIVFLSSILGWKRGVGYSKVRSTNCLCLNHFVTDRAYKFSPPYGVYCEELYKSLVPIVGSKEVINDFLGSNEWMGDRIYIGDSRHIYKEKSSGVLYWESILSGSIGDYIEKVLKRMQLVKIKRSVNRGTHHRPRIKYTDEELEFHPDVSKYEGF